MGFYYISKKTNKKYYLHKKKELYYFSKDSNDNVRKPKEYRVIENKKTGLPMLKKITNV